MAQFIVGRLGRMVAATALALGGHAVQAYTVSLGPASQTVLEGSVVTATVTASASDLALIGLGAYNFDFTFDAGILAFSTATSALALGVGSDFLFDDGVGGMLSLLEVSHIDVPSLLALQADALSRSTELMLFTLSFTTVGTGTTTLGFSGGAMSDANGDNEELFGQFTSNDASIAVLENLGVPTPGTLPLALVAVLAAALVRRRA